ncbi:enoyl-CoA hydratase/isomerase family protein [Salinibacillus xinjiangensis]|uniref:Enoyl-CoA hydratase n=1 Tax=Salinibacillus xinjiangensis TaxID=1229268 RepID=A0A6G1X1U0_9BACI|nr:enoyl-CoA hydratase/isomerase family protein [Salinibacillus xinjiangensis]MRG84904.1 enoyl-CoA hydratase [Salinibacillus xinjiangensis]
MTDRHILFETRDDGIAVLTLNRPDFLNSFSHEMISDWHRYLIEFDENPDLNVLIVTAKGRAFSAGGDIKALAKGEGFIGEPKEDLWSNAFKRKEALWGNIQKIALKMEEIDKPVLSCINGAAIGAGLDMALMCDIRFCAEHAKLGEGYINLGLVPGDGGGYFLPKLVGIPKALEMLWTGDRIKTEEALRIGLVDYVYPAEEIFDRTMDFANVLNSKPQQTVRMMKRLVKSHHKVDLRTHLDMVSSHMAVVTDTNEYIELLEQMKKS